MFHQTSRHVNVFYVSINSFAFLIFTYFNWNALNNVYPTQLRIREKQVKNTANILLEGKDSKTKIKKSKLTSPVKEEIIKYLKKKKL